MSRHWVQSYSGKMVTPRALEAGSVRFRDIPHALAQKVRYNGQLREPGYTVAQHCVMGATAIEPAFALAFLLHEVSEVYLPDIPTPLKNSLSIELADLTLISWRELENRHADVIFDALGLKRIRHQIDSDEVHEADIRMLMTEKRDLMGPEPKSWGIDVKPYPFKIDRVWPYAEARTAFERMYAQLRLYANISR